AGRARFQSVPNLVLYDGTQGGIIATAEKPFFSYGETGGFDYMEDVPFTVPDVTHNKCYRNYKSADPLPIPYNRVGRNMLRIRVSDRCKGKCVFCVVPRQKLVADSVGTVIDIIKTHRGDIDSIHFEDPDLLNDRDYLVGLCNALIENGLDNLPKHCNAVANEVDPDILRLLAKAGFTLISYGIETFDDGILNKLDKGTTAGQNENAIRWTLEAGMKPGMNAILVSPWATKETILHDIDRYLYYIERGAHIGCGLYLRVNFESKRFFKKYPDLVEYREIYFPGMKSPLRYPWIGKILDDEAREFSPKVEELVRAYKKELSVPKVCRESIAIESLLIFKAIYALTGQPKEKLDRIDRLIKDIARKEIATLTPLVIQDGRSRADETEKQIRETKTAGQGTMESDAAMTGRRQAMHRLNRELSAYLRENRGFIPFAEREILLNLIRRAKTLSRENPLYHAPSSPGIIVAKRGCAFSFFQGDEKFNLLSLNKDPFFTHPYQITVSITPPGAEQEIHGHSFTDELTVSLGTSLNYSLFRNENGVMVKKRSGALKRFDGILFGADTPHAISNTGTAECKNVTVKYGAGVLDRWSLKEKADWSKTTYEGDVISPLMETKGAARVYSFKKGKVWYRIVVIPAGSEFRVPLGQGEEKGYVVIDGDIEAQDEKAPDVVCKASQEDSIYFNPGDASVKTIMNRSGREAVLFGVDLEPDRAPAITVPSGVGKDTLLIAKNCRGPVKDHINGVLQENGIDLFDLSIPGQAEGDYTALAEAAAGFVSEGRFKRAVLIGDSDDAAMGMSIVANKFNGVRAALCRTREQAELAKRHNDANILILTAADSAELPASLINSWLSAVFEDGKHLRRVRKIRGIEKAVDFGSAREGAARRPSVWHARKIVPIASDHGGYALKEKVKQILAGMGYEPQDLGPRDTAACDYPDYGTSVAEQVSYGDFKRGILICNTGIGMSIAANKFPEVRAALCSTPGQAEASRAGLDANILVMGQRYTGDADLVSLLKAFLDTEYDPNRLTNLRNNGALAEIEKEKRLAAAVRGQEETFKGILSPDLAMSDLDYTLFLNDDEPGLAEKIRAHGEKAIAMKLASVSIYPQHIKYLPVKEMQDAGIRIGGVAGFPSGLHKQGLEKSVRDVGVIMESGGDEVDVVMDFESILEGRPARAEEGLKAFTEAVGQLQARLGKTIRIKTILETCVLDDEEKIRQAARIALKYSDMIKMVTGFPQERLKDKPNDGDLRAARIMLEEIKRYHEKTGILKGMKVTGGIRYWNDRRLPDRSARAYYELTERVFGAELAYDYLVNHDLFRIGGKGSLENFIAAKKDIVRIVKVKENKVEKPGYDEIKSAIRRSMGADGISAFIAPGDRILIKPNIGSTEADVNAGGFVTNPMVVRAMIDMLLENGIRPEQITIGEGTLQGQDTMHNFKELGYDTMGVRLVDLDTAETREVEIPGGKAKKSIRLPVVLLESDVIINMPVLKTNRYTGISVAMKNMKGVISKAIKASFHGHYLNQSIVDLNKAVSQKRMLVVVDAIMGQEGYGPFGGSPKPMNLIISGTNPALTDWACAKIMGFDPGSIKTLTLAEEDGLADYGRIDVEGAAIEEVQSAFDPSPTYREMVKMEGFEVYDQKACSACTGNLTRFIKKDRAVFDGIIDILRKNGETEINFVLGPAVDIPAHGFNILLGHCAGRHKENGLCFFGCPVLLGDVGVVTEYLQYLYDAGFTRKEIYRFFNRRTELNRAKTGNRDLRDILTDALIEAFREKLQSVRYAYLGKDGASCDLGAVTSPLIRGITRAVFMRVLKEAGLEQQADSFAVAYYGSIANRSYINGSDVDLGLFADDSIPSATYAMVLARFIRSMKGHGFPQIHFLSQGMLNDYIRKKNIPSLIERSILEELDFGFGNRDLFKEQIESLRHCVKADMEESLIEFVFDMIRQKHALPPSGSSSMLDLKRAEGALRDIGRIKWLAEVLRAIRKEDAPLEDVMRSVYNEEELESMRAAKRLYDVVRNEQHAIGYDDADAATVIRLIAERIPWAGTDKELTGKLQGAQDLIIILLRKMHSAIMAEIRNRDPPWYGSFNRLYDIDRYLPKGMADVPAGEFITRPSLCMLVARLCEDQKIITDIFEHYKDTPNWGILFCLAMNEATPANLLSYLSGLTGTEYDDVRLMAARNKNTEDRVLFDLLNDGYDDVIRAAAMALTARFDGFKQVAGFYGSAAGVMIQDRMKRENEHDYQRAVADEADSLWAVKRLAAILNIDSSGRDIDELKRKTANAVYDAGEGVDERKTGNVTPDYIPGACVMGALLENGKTENGLFKMIVKDKIDFARNVMAEELRGQVPAEELGEFLALYQGLLSLMYRGGEKDIDARTHDELLNAMSRLGRLYFRSKGREVAFFAERNRRLNDFGCKLADTYGMSVEHANKTFREKVKGLLALKITANLLDVFTVENYRKFMEGNADEYAKELSAEAAKPFAIDRFDEFYNRVVEGADSIEWDLDNNGETVLSLYLIQTIVDRWDSLGNTDKKIYIVPKSVESINDATYDDVMGILERAPFGNLRRAVKEGRVVVFRDGPRGLGTDYTGMTAGQHGLLEEIISRKGVIVKEGKSNLLTIPRGRRLPDMFCLVPASGPVMKSIIGAFNRDYYGRAPKAIIYIPADISAGDISPLTGRHPTLKKNYKDFDRGLSMLERAGSYINDRSVAMRLVKTAMAAKKMDFNEAAARVCEDLEAFAQKIGIMLPYDAGAKAGWADFRCYSNNSAGTLSPAELVVAAKMLGLADIALCDLHTISGLKEFAAAGKEWGVQVTPGIEFLTEDGVSIAGYGIDPDDTLLGMRLDGIRSRREMPDGREALLSITMAGGQPVFAKADDFLKGKEDEGLRSGLSQEAARLEARSSFEKALRSYIVYGLAGIELNYSTCRPEDAEYINTVAETLNLRTYSGSGFDGTAGTALYLGAADPAMHAILRSMGISAVRDKGSLLGSVDLHCYTDRSIGRFSPRTVVRAAAFLGLKAIAVTDRDSIDGIAEAVQAGLEYGIDVVPGIELQAEIGSEAVCLIGYGMDWEDRSFRSRLSLIKRAPRRTVSDAVKLIHDFGGKVMLARPGMLADAIREKTALGEEEACDRAAKLITKHFFPVGLDGIEATYAAHSPYQNEYFKQWAWKHGIALTGGSGFADFEKDGVSLGAGNTPAAYYFKYCLGMDFMFDKDIDMPNVLDVMSVEEKIAFILAPQATMYIPTPEGERLFGKYGRSGGRINAREVEETGIRHEMLKRLFAFNRFPILVNLNQEGGRLNSFMIHPFTLFAGNMALNAIADTDKKKKLAYEVGKAIALEIRSFGFSWNFAPVLDVFYSFANPSLGTKAFGGDAGENMTLSAEFIRGMQENGVLATAKHFPGYGRLTSDPHNVLPVVDEVADGDLAVFKGVIESGAGSMMPGHMIALNLDPDNNVTFSEKILRGILRGTLGFRGLLVSDSMRMGAVAGELPLEDGAIKAVNAGMDMILMNCHFARARSDLYGVQEENDTALEEDTPVFNALVNAVRDGRIPLKRIDDAVARIFEAMRRYGIKDIDTCRRLEENIDFGRHRQVSQELSDLSVTLLKNEGDILPVNAAPDDRITVVTMRRDRPSTAESAWDSGYSLLEPFRALHQNTVGFDSAGIEDVSPEDWEKIDGSKYVVVGIYLAYLPSKDGAFKQKEFVDELIRRGKQPIVIAMGAPYDIVKFPDVDAFLCVYNVNPTALNAAAKAVFGHVKPQGKLPVEIDDTFKKGFGLTTGAVREKKDGDKKIAIAMIALSAPEFPSMNQSCAVSVLSGDLKHQFGEGVSVDILDMYTDHSLTAENIAERIIETRPDVMAFSVPFYTFDRAKEIIRIVKERLGPRDMPMVVLGKSVPNYSADLVLKDHLPEAIMATGEGEVALRGIVEYLQGKKRSLEEVANIVFMKDGKPFNNGRTMLDLRTSGIPDMSYLETVPLEKRKTFPVALESSRGCPWGRCSMCAVSDLLGWPTQPYRWRSFPLERVFNQLDHVLGLGYRNIGFIDEEFVGPGMEGVRHMRQIAEWLLARPEKDISFMFSCRVDSVVNPADTPEEQKERDEAFLLMKKAGLKKIFVGIECGSQEQLDRFNKGIKVANSEAVIPYIREKLRIDIEVGFIMFDPLMKFESIAESVAFIRRTGIARHISNIFKETRVYIGTTMATTTRRDHPGLISPVYDINTGEYEVEYLDPRVKKLKDVITRWQNEGYDLWYSLKSVTRIVLASEERNSYLFSAMDGLRELDLDTIESLLAIFKDGIPPDEKIADVLTSKRLERDRIIHALSDFLRDTMIDLKARNMLLAGISTYESRAAGATSSARPKNTGDEIVYYLMKGSYDDIRRAFALYRYYYQGSQIPGDYSKGPPLPDYVLNMIMLTANAERDAVLRADWRSFISKVTPVKIALDRDGLEGIRRFMEAPDDGAREAAAEKSAQELLDRILSPLGDDEDRSLTVRTGPNTGDLPEAVVWTRPRGTFNRELLREVMKRLDYFGYEIVKVRVFGGGYLRSTGLIRRNAIRLFFDLDENGRVKLTGDDKRQLEKLYGRPDFAAQFGMPAAQCKIYTPMDLLDRFSMTAAQIETLWNAGHSDELRPGRRVCPMSHAAVNNGEAFFLMNGYATGYFTRFEEPDNRMAAFFVRAKGSHYASEKRLSVEFKGRTDPKKALPGSVRRDAFEKLVRVNGEVSAIQNVIHSTDGDLVSVHDALDFLNIAIEETSFGRMLIRAGYTVDEIRMLLANPAASVGDKQYRLFDLTKEQSQSASLEIIRRYFPPAGKALPEEDTRTGRRTVVGKMTVAGQDIEVIEEETVDTDLIKPPVVIARNENDRHEIESTAETALRSGTVGLITVAGGMSSRAD
ncbi:MAG: RpiB/LacA/LacB family sugar-phosphate isomerase, partial [Candidatus Omnitrophica bacterium]|nr:RpiB/LacA/LacB family sugar-phosphate isomerase [Candidatus Omnitrophota bacterium]